MNVLFRTRKEIPIAGLIPFRYLLYATLLSDVVSYTPDDEDTKYGVFTSDRDIYDCFSDWDSDDVYKALDDLSSEGLVSFDEDGRIYLGEFRGKKFFPFEVKSSLFDSAYSLLETELKRYGSSRSAKDKSRARYIKEQVNRFLDKGVEHMTPGDFTELHGYLYEVYTGGEIYIIRNKTEHFQTNNMLKAYDKFTVFALIVESTLNYGTYKKKGMPTLINVACMKDDVFRSLTKGDGSKDYMNKEDCLGGEF